MNLDGKRILIIKPSSLGDVVHTLPVVHAIKRRHPSCHIGWIIQQTFAGIVTSDPAVDEIIPISIPSTSDPQAQRGVFLQAAKATLRTLMHLRKRFRLKPYDLVLDLHASLRSGLFAKSNPNGLRIGLADAKEFNTLFQHHCIVTDPEKPHAVDKNLSFASYLQCDPLDEDFNIVTDPKARASVKSFLTDEGIRPDDKIIYANPSARWESKFWTVQGWARLADMLIREAGAKVCFAGSPQDLPHMTAITEMMLEKATVAAGRLDLAGAVALIEASDVYVGVDSGPMHIAAFAGTPVVALFGPTDPAKVGPYGTGHRVIQHSDLDCLTCRKRTCDDHQCLDQITPEQVFAETRSVLATI